MNWSHWKLHCRQRDNLYADWFEFLDSRRSGIQHLPKSVQDIPKTQPFEPQQGKHFTDNLEDLFDFHAQYVLRPESLVAAFGTDNLAIPDFALNPNYNPEHPPWTPPPEMPHLHRDTCIVGVIDTGCPLTHRRTRTKDGNTRFIASWQQGADISMINHCELEKRFNHLPYGRELLSHEIDDLLAKHSSGGIKHGWIDEDAFNRDAGLVDFNNTAGHRLLASRDAHGASVLDLAAGYDSFENPELSEKIRLIAINLPHRQFFADGGPFMLRYVTTAVLRIIEIADALAKRACDHPNPKYHPKHGSHYPIIINLSFGMQAGSRDENSLLAELMNDLNEKRPIKLIGDTSEGEHDIAGRTIEGGAVCLTIPTANDNLSRGNLRRKLTSNREFEFKWRILPEDQTSNFLEIWSEPIPGDVEGLEELPIQISVQPPNRTNSKLEGAQPRHINELDDFVRIYCEVINLDHKQCGPAYRIQYLVCTAPTLIQDAKSQTAPSGSWKIKLLNKLDYDLNVAANVQTDQSALPFSITGHKSYFDDPSYVIFDETTGRRVDTFGYSPHGGGVSECRPDLDMADHVKRRGSLNALVSNNSSMISAAGYRATDGAPADYSGTSAEEFDNHPAVALVTDDGAAHPGILASGSRDGSTVAVQGTSFASAQLAKIFAELVVDGEQNIPLAPRKWIERQAEEQGGLIRTTENWFPSKTHRLKTGHGRLPRGKIRDRGFERY